MTTDIESINGAAPGTPQYYQNAYQEELARSRDMPTEEALMLLMVNLNLTIGAYEQANEEQIATNMQSITDIQNENSQIENDFDQFNEYEKQLHDTRNPQDRQAIIEEEKKTMNDAITLATNIANQLENPSLSSISSSVMSSIDTIFEEGKAVSNHDDRNKEKITISIFHKSSNGHYTPDYTDSQEIAEYYWTNAWANSSTTGTNTSLQPITNSFSAIQNSTDGLSSSSGSELQFWQSSTQQTESSQEALMQSFVSLLSVIINNSGKS